MTGGRSLRKGPERGVLRMLVRVVGRAGMGAVACRGRKLLLLLLLLLLVLLMLVLELVLVCGNGRLLVGLGGGSGLLGGCVMLQEVLMVLESLVDFGLLRLGAGGHRGLRVHLGGCSGRGPSSE
uniref:Uncharacterized protein n=1 Tax=Anopheles atroparvus TaxID=41427 RepID=A0AAG5DTK2_ANOAO